MFDDPFCQFPTFDRDFFAEFIETAFFERWGSFWRNDNLSEKSSFIDFRIQSKKF